MDAITRRTIFLVSITAAIISFTTVGNAQFGETSTVIGKRNWTDAEIADEARRYTFFPPELQFPQRKNTAKPGLVILSGFLKVGKYWRELGWPTANNAAALERRDQLMADYGSVASVQISVLANLIRLIPAQREGNWICATSIGCYPKGYVVGLGPVDSETAELVCKKQRHNGNFCHIFR